MKLGFDLARARELQWLFTNARIAARRNEHVLDSFQGFADALGVRERRLRQSCRCPPRPATMRAQLIPDGSAVLVVSPCSSHVLRNWRAERYAAVIDHGAA